MLRVLRRPLGFVMVNGEPVWALDALAGFWLGNVGVGAMIGAAIAAVRQSKGKKPLADLGEPGYDLAAKICPRTFQAVSKLVQSDTQDVVATDEQKVEEDKAEPQLAIC